MFNIGYQFQSTHVDSFPNKTAYVYSHCGKMLVLLVLFLYYDFFIVHFLRYKKRSIYSLRLNWAYKYVFVGSKFRDSCENVSGLFTCSKFKGIM